MTRTSTHIGLRKPTTRGQRPRGCGAGRVAEPVAEESAALVTGVLTATAALTSSWLSIRSTIRAAELNIRFGSARARHEQRRTAYVDLLTSVTEIRWRTRDLAARAGARDTTAITDYRAWRGIAGNSSPAAGTSSRWGPDKVQESVRR
jgi:hypothetical protein